MGGDTIGVLQAGVPNIIGSIIGIAHGATVAMTTSGAFSVVVNSNKGNATGPGSTDNVSFNAADSNAIYGASDTVQPPSLQLLPQIKY